MSPYIFILQCYCSFCYHCLLFSCLLGVLVASCIWRSWVATTALSSASSASRLPPFLRWSTIIPSTSCQSRVLSICRYCTLSCMSCYEHLDCRIPSKMPQWVSSMMSSLVSAYSLQSGTEKSVCHLHHRQTVRQSEKYAVDNWDRGNIGFCICQLCDFVLGNCFALYLL